MLLKLITAFPNACILNAKNQKYWFHGNHQKFIITLITCTSKDIFNIFLFYICMFTMLILKFWSLHSLVEHCSSLYIHVAKSISFHCNRKGKRVYIDIKPRTWINLTLIKYSINMYFAPEINSFWLL